jgi:hypothetical protein
VIGKRIGENLNNRKRKFEEFTHLERKMNPFIMNVLDPSEGS